jgi:acyl-coenzyme A thioesterase PaaI-like protein
MTEAAFAKAASISMLQTLGITLTERGESHAVMEVTVGEQHSNFHGKLMVFYW